MCVCVVFAPHTRTTPVILHKFFFKNSRVTDRTFVAIAPAINSYKTWYVSPSHLYHLHYTDILSITSRFYVNTRENPPRSSWTHPLGPPPPSPSSGPPQGGFSPPQGGPQPDNRGWGMNGGNNNNRWGPPSGGGGGGGYGGGGGGWGGPQGGGGGWGGPPAGGWGGPPGGGYGGPPGGGWGGPPGGGWSGPPGGGYGGGPGNDFPPPYPL